MDARTAHVVAEMMQALATPSRVRILSRIAHAPCTVTEICRAIGMEQPAVSQQLRVLRHLGFVTGTREGRHVTYALVNDHVRALLEEAVSHSEHLGFAPRVAQPLAVAGG